jgi:formate dehydrogenase subunit gamma
MGTEALARHIEGRTGCRFDAAHAAGTGAEGKDHGTGNEQVELQSVYCLGQCALSPSMTINGELHVKVTPQKFDALLEKARANAQASIASPKECA